MAVIFHIDLDSFFVSAERLRDRALIGRCVAVGGTGERGVISSASYEARKFGVRSAMPTAQARRLCPGLILRFPDFELYSKLSKEVFAIAGEFSPVVEATGIDEGYLDMTGSRSLFGEPLVAAEKLRRRVRERTGLTISVGIAANRLVAKIATDQFKPDNCGWVKEGDEAAFLAPLSVAKLPGCGKVTHEWLNQQGIFTIGELQRFSLSTLERQLGRFGTYLHESAWGRGSVAFHEEAKVRSISRENTFTHDVWDREELKRELWSMCADLGQTLRKDGDHARAIRLKLRYPPFETVTRSRVLKAPTQLDRALHQALEILFEENWDSSRPLRLLGVGCVLGDATHQLGLFETAAAETDARHEKLDHLKDLLRSKFGDDALKTGRDLARSQAHERPGKRSDPDR